MRTNPPKLKLLVAVTLIAAWALSVQAEILISEIMYNPASYEGGGPDNDPNQTEWLELYNTGKEEVSLAGWFLQDEDGKTARLPASAKIKPGEAVVLIPGVQNPADFRKAWGEGFQVFALKNWHEGRGSLRNLANSPSSSDEVLTLRDKAGKVVDEVNYDDEGYWPSDSPQGPSIVLTPANLTADKNDDGKSWARSEAGKLGANNAKRTDEYSSKDVGSPGKVVTE